MFIFCGYAENGGYSVVNIRECRSISVSNIIGDKGGGICGENSCYSTTSGGVASRVELNISNCYNNTRLFTGSSSGGICGNQAAYSDGYGCVSVLNIYDCYNTGIVAISYAGGICGPYAGNSRNYGISIIIINNCYSLGDITNLYSGGICGPSFGHSETNGTTYATINNCYSTGEISGPEAGGVCGSLFGYYNYEGSSISKISCCYSVGRITIIWPRVGGILGAYPFCGEITHCYCLDWNDIDLINDYASGRMFGTIPIMPQNFTITECSFNNGLDESIFTPVQLQTLISNSSCYNSIRRCISDNTINTAPFLDIFNDTSIWYPDLSCLNIFSPDLKPVVISNCSEEILNNVYWSATGGGITITGNCDSGIQYSNGIFRRGCQLDGIWEPTILKCTTKCHAEILNNVIWPETDGGTIATGTCKTGINLEELKRTCAFNGQWENTTLFCSSTSNKKIVDKYKLTAEQKVGIIIGVCGCVYILYILFWFSSKGVYDIIYTAHTSLSGYFLKYNC